jgi:hypothetical protein
MHLRILILGILVLIGCIIYVRNYFTEGFQTTQSQYQYTGLYVAPPANDTLKTRSNFWEILNKEKSGQPITRGSDSGSAGSLLNKVMNPEPNDVFKMVYPKYISMYALAKYEYNPIHARKALINDFDTLQTELETAVEQEQSDRDKFTGSSSKPIEESCKTLNSITVGMYGKLIQIQRNIKNLNNSEKLAENLHKENIELQKAVSSGSSKPCVWQDMQPSDDCIKLATMSEKLFPLLPTFDNFNIKILTDGQAIQDMIDVLLQAYKGIGCPLTNSSVLGSSGGSNPLNVIDIFSETYIDSLDIIDTDSLYETLQILSPYYISQNMIKFISNRLTKTKTLDIETSTTADYLLDIGEITQSIVSLNTDVSPLQSGQVYDKTNNNFKNCPPGYYCPPISSTPIQCPVGSYCPGANISGTTIERPIPCPPGDYSPPGASMISQCSKTAPLGYYIDKDGKAIQCRTGHYCINGTVIMCPSGTYNMKKGMSSIDSCLICPPGSFCPTTTSIAPCPKGTYNPGTGKSRTDDCIKCGAGKTCFEKGLSSPIDCPVGTFSSVVGLTGSCIPVQGGYYLTGTGNTTSDTRKACTVGNYCPGGSGQQIPCPAGSYCPNEQMAAPTPCPGGRYGNTTGLSMPACSGPCAAGYYCSEGSTTPNQTVCPAGYYCSEGSSAPIPCPRGSYCPEKSTSPTKCPAGTYNCGTEARSFSDCRTCPGGHYCREGTTCLDDYSKGSGSGSGSGSSSDPCLCSSGSGEVPAVPCRSGYYCPPASTTEVSCNAGYYCPHTKMTAEIPCPAGTKCPTIRMTAPQVCPVGTYNADTGKQDCALCILGTYNPTAGAIGCRECPSGTRCPSTGMSAPQPCPVGETSTGGSSSCTACPPGTYCPSSGGSRAILCPPGTYCPGGGSQPTQCEVSKYCPIPGLTAGSPCPPGKLCSNTGGSTPSGDCPPGMYSTGGAPPCLNCRSGRYGNGGNTGPECSGLCPAGYYCPPGSMNPYSSGSGIGQLCPEGHYCPVGQGTTCRAGQQLLNGRCVTCPNGRTRGTVVEEISTTSDCRPCEDGMYSWNTVPNYLRTNTNPNTQAQILTPGMCYRCPIGSYCKNGVITACPDGQSTAAPTSATMNSAGASLPGHCAASHCLPGYMCKGGKNILCPQGTYNDTGGNSSCKEIPIGKVGINYVSSELSLGATNIAPCDAGTSTFPSQSASIDLQYDGRGYLISSRSATASASVRSNLCEACPAGKRSGPGTACLNNCSEGSGLITDPNNVSKCLLQCSIPGTGYNNNSPTCVDCPADKYSEDSLCKLCPAGKSTYGFIKQTECINCERGTFSVSGSQCTSCETGTTSTAGSAVCDECVAGTFTTRGSPCVPCREGSISARKSGSCTPCEAGKFETGTQTSCSNCPAGYTSTEGSTSCTACPAGTHASSPGSPFCSNCPAGTYSTQGSVFCPPCQAGTISSREGSASCTPCEAGTYTASQSMSDRTLSIARDVCTPCPAGTYTSATRSTWCLPCPAGTYAFNQGTITCTDCEAGSYCPDARTRITCSSGTTSPARSTSESACVAGSTNNSGGRVGEIIYEILGPFAPWWTVFL